MNILLLSMPDSFEHMPTVAIRMPNGALTSLAGNIDPHHKVAVADLILVPKRVRETVCAAGPHDKSGRGRPVRDDFSAQNGPEDRRLIRSLKPDVQSLWVVTTPVWQLTPTRT